jgi:hypothetical protein
MVMAYFRTQGEMVEQFSRQNTCDACYISTRANTEKTAREFVEDNTAILRKALAPWIWRREREVIPSVAEGGATGAQSGNEEPARRAG